jgi:hypothetical protein
VIVKLVIVIEATIVRSDQMSKDIKPIPPLHCFGELLHLAEPPNDH